MWKDSPVDQHLFSCRGGVFALQESCLHRGVHTLVQRRLNMEGTGWLFLCALPCDALSLSADAKTKRHQIAEALQCSGCPLGVERNPEGAVDKGLTFSSPYPKTKDSD